MIRIESNTFAESCYDMNSIEDFEQALQDGPDTTDMETWGLTEQEWRDEVELALAAKREDEEE